MSVDEEQYIETTNLYPNDGLAFAQPKEQEDEKEKENKEELDALPVLQALVERWEERIRFYDSVGAYRVDPTIDAATFEKIIHINTGMVDNLTEELSAVKDIIANHLP